MDGIFHLLLSAGNLMLIGMAFVFTFLGLVVVVTGWLAKFAPEPQSEPRMATPVSQPAIPLTSAADPRLMAAIAAAVHRYRSRQVNR